MTALLLALLLAAQPSPCDPVQPAPRADPAAAASYRTVGDAERASGARDTATTAYRLAASLDPADPDSRRALRELCETEGAAAVDPFRRGVERMERGDLREAVADFQAVRAARPDAPSALLEGVCLYRLGDDRGAEPAFHAAEGDPEVGDTARFYLGLIALRRGDSQQAAPLFDGLVASSGYGLVAADMALIVGGAGSSPCRRWPPWGGTRT